MDDRLIVRRRIVTRNGELDRLVPVWPGLMSVRIRFGSSTAVSGHAQAARQS
jgi:hypothetical protein